MKVLLVLSTSILMVTALPLLSHDIITNERISLNTVDLSKDVTLVTEEQSSASLFSEICEKLKSFITQEVKKSVQEEVKASLSSKAEEGLQPAVLQPTAGDVKLVASVFNQAFKTTSDEDIVASIPLVLRDSGDNQATTTIQQETTISNDNDSTTAVEASTPAVTNTPLDETTETTSNINEDGNTESSIAARITNTTTAGVTEATTNEATETTQTTMLIIQNTTQEETTEEDQTTSATTILTTTVESADTNPTGKVDDIETTTIVSATTKDSSTEIVVIGTTVVDAVGNAMVNSTETSRIAANDDKLSIRIDDVSDAASTEVVTETTVVNDVTNPIVNSTETPRKLTIGDADVLSIRIDDDTNNILKKRTPDEETKIEAEGKDSVLTVENVPKLDDPTVQCPKFVDVSSDQMKTDTFFIPVMRKLPDNTCTVDHYIKLLFGKFE